MAVYTKISHNELEQLIAGYNIGMLQSFTAIEAGIQNSNYFINTTKARFILTIYERRTNLEDLPFFLKLMEHLAGQGVLCPAVIMDKNGNAISKIAGKSCAIVSFLQGKEVDTIKNEHVAELGKNIAKMHIASNNFKMQRENELSLNGWLEVYDSIKNRINEFEPGLTKELEEKLDFLMNHWPKNLPSGIIHADIFPDNVFFDHDKLVGIIDFYFACNDYFMYELAICINSWCFEKNYTLNQEKVSLLISSYNKIRKISSEEMAALPILAKGAAMRFLLTRLYSWLNRSEGALVTTKDPMEYLTKLRFHSSIKSYEEYGLLVRSS